MMSRFIRWLRFNAAGLLGVGVQLLALAAFVRHMDVRLATALAVEIAVLHNFVWHERVTWREIVRKDSTGCFRRLLRSHLSNGLISLIGNVLLMHLFVRMLGLSPLRANFISILLCSFANFCASEWFVFAPTRLKPPPGEQMFI